MTTRITCPTCHGTGDHPHPHGAQADCPDCNGSGEVYATPTEKEIRENARWLRRSYAGTHP